MEKNAHFDILYEKAKLYKETFVEVVFDNVKYKPDDEDQSWLEQYVPIKRKEEKRELLIEVVQDLLDGGHDLCRGKGAGGIEPVLLVKLQNLGIDQEFDDLVMLVQGRDIAGFNALLPGCDDDLPALLPQVLDQGIEDGGKIGPGQRRKPIETVIGPGFHDVQGTNLDDGLFGVRAGYIPDNHRRLSGEEISKVIFEQGGRVLPVDALFEEDVLEFFRELDFLEFSGELADPGNERRVAGVEPEQGLIGDECGIDLFLALVQIGQLIQ